jgi:hypothetical protein
MRALKVCWRHPKMKILLRCLIFLVIILLYILARVDITEKETIPLLCVVLFEITIILTLLGGSYYAWHRISERKRLENIPQYQV